MNGCDCGADRSSNFHAFWCEGFGIAIEPGGLRPKTDVILNAQAHTEERAVTTQNAEKFTDVDKVLIRLAHGMGPFKSDEHIEIINWLASREMFRRANPDPLTTEVPIVR